MKAVTEFSKVPGVVEGPVHCPRFPDPAISNFWDIKNDLGQQARAHYRPDTVKRRLEMSPIDSTGFKLNPGSVLHYKSSKTDGCKIIK